ncbi:MAG: class II glutamine amidotransferase [Gammaproteobacteria bacterium]
MSRLSAYLGPPVALDYVLPDFAGGLEQQGYNFGIGWYAPDGSPAVYTHPIPICLDANLPHLARSLTSGLWLFQTSGVAALASVSHPVVQPFLDDDFIFVHQGYIEDFRTALYPTMPHFLSPEIEAQMYGRGEAEYLFALLRHLLADDEEMSIDQAMFEMFALLDDWLGGLAAYLNIIVSDGEGLYAARHAINAECAPLYYNTDDEIFPNAQLIAGEPLTQSGFWQPVPEHHILILSADEPPELLAL